jgi:hypothetical protein
MGTVKRDEEGVEVFQCGECGAQSAHPQDIRLRYCAMCGRSEIDRPMLRKRAQPENIEAR